MLTQDRPLAQASAAEHQPGLINPSRCITKDDEAYLRDYTLAASVISWDSGTFGTSLQVTAGDITNIAITGDTVWYQINLHRAIPLDIETFHAHRLRIQLHKAELEVAEKDCQQEQQPDGEAGDSVSCQLQPTQSALTEFEIGRCHGQADAEARQHPIYTKPKSEYAIGYLEGYHGNSTQQPPAPTQPVEWSVVYDPRWQCYQAWVKDRCVGHGSTPEQAERIAQFSIAFSYSYCLGLVSAAQHSNERYEVTQESYLEYSFSSYSARRF